MSNTEFKDTEIPSLRHHYIERIKFHMKMLNYYLNVRVKVIYLKYQTVWVIMFVRILNLY